MRKVISPEKKKMTVYNEKKEDGAPLVVIAINANGLPVFGVSGSFVSQRQDASVPRSPVSQVPVVPVSQVPVVPVSQEQKCTIRTSKGCKKKAKEIITEKKYNDDIDKYNFTVEEKRRYNKNKGKICRSCMTPKQEKKKKI